jgi:class 3 adenylate cyclase
MFSDLVGSTALSARMDPEDLREVISAYQKCVAQVVQRFDGFSWRNNEKQAAPRENSKAAFQQLFGPARLWIPEPTIT